jgi:hypothetical protein
LGQRRAGSAEHSGDGDPDSERGNPLVPAARALEELGGCAITNRGDPSLGYRARSLRPCGRLPKGLSRRYLSLRSDQSHGGTSEQIPRLSVAPSQQKYMPCKQICPYPVQWIEKCAFSSADIGLSERMRPSPWKGYGRLRFRCARLNKNICQVNKSAFAPYNGSKSAHSLQPTSAAKECGPLSGKGWSIEGRP